MVKFLHILIILLIFASWIGRSSYHPIRGKSVAPSTISTTDIIKRTDNMTKMKPLTQVLKEFYDIHGDRYIYTNINKSNYRGGKSIVSVICREHGEFPISVSNHLRGQGCPDCARIQRRISNTGNVRKRTKLVYGVGFNDYNGNIKYNHVHIPSYHTWVEMLKRCFCDNFKNRNKTYTECNCCDEWKSFSAFKMWFDNPANGYKDGYCLDKDILIKGNKIYSPSTCCFVPNEINVLLWWHTSTTTSKNIFTLALLTRQKKHLWRTRRQRNLILKKWLHNTLMKAKSQRKCTML